MNTSLCGMKHQDESVHVLHVDDDPDFVDVADTFLKREDERFNIETTTSASEGLDRLAEGTFDCIISDYDMPGQNGIEFLNTVRDKYPDLPFILFTGKGSEEVASEAISAGVTDYLKKGRGTEQYELLANRILNAVDACQSRQLAQGRKRRLETLISNLPGMVYRCPNDPKWPIESAEGEVEELTGYSADTFENNELLWGIEIVHPDDREPMWEAVQEGLSENGSFEVTYRISTKNGHTKWLWERGRGVYSEPGELEALEGFITDITEQREREREFEQTNAVLSTLFEALPVGILAEDEDQNVLAVNKQMFDLFERPGSPDEVVGADCERMAHEVSEMFSDPDGFVERINDLVASREPANSRELSLDDGRTFEQSYQPIQLPDGNGQLWMYRDITDHKERERKLEARNEELAELTAELREQYRHLFEEAPVMSVKTRAEDREPVIEECNQRFLDTLGYDRSAVIERDLAEFYTPESSEALLEEDGYERALSDEFVREERELVTSDGETVETLLRAVPRRDTDEGISGTLAMYVDITERKQLKRETERLEQFSSIVSHDLRNPLNVAEGRLRLAREECDSEQLDAVANAHDRMNALIGDLLMLAREDSQVSETEPVHLADLAEDCWWNVDTAEATIRTLTDRTIQADRSRLAQLLENLFRNAVEHGGDDVTITIGELDDGFYVEDDGPGIPEDKQDDVFDTGYSTVEDGTGFGLSIVGQVADAHDWDICVTKGSNDGARFEITGLEFAE